MKITIRKVTSLILLGCLYILLAANTGCEQSVDSQQSEQQEKMLQDQQSQVGLPDIHEWTEKKMMKEILELRDNSKLITYAYLQNINGKLLYLGQCVGFGLPYSTQYTNPERYAYNGVSLPQADPNGLFSAQGVSATWIQYFNSDTGKREVIYCEPNVVITQSKLPKRLCEEWSLPKDY